jgi:hypothetical protein
MVAKKISAESGVAARPATSNIKLLARITAPHSATRGLNNRRPIVYVAKMVPTPNAADQNRAANSFTPKTL